MTTTDIERGFVDHLGTTKSSGNFLPFDHNDVIERTAAVEQSMRKSQATWPRSKNPTWLFAIIEAKR